MQYSLATFALLAISGFATAQIPACAKPAIDKATQGVGCEVTDYACACTTANQAAIQAAATADVVAACGADVALTQVLPAAQALCKSPPTASGPPVSIQTNTSTLFKPNATATPSGNNATNATAIPSGNNATNATAAPTSSSTIVPASGATQLVVSLGGVLALAIVAFAAF